jgi:predicted Zn-dependent peptidase
LETVDVKFDANQSKYAKHLPVGTEEVVMNFKPEELRNYYHKWYRPDLQELSLSETAIK